MTPRYRFQCLEHDFQCQTTLGILTHLGDEYGIS